MKIKITPMGGYVVGDGPCPFDPDQFLILFGHKIIEAQRQGLDEILVDPDAVIATAKERFADAVLAAPTHSVSYTGKPDITHMIGLLPEVQN
jgi:hypothetical protein